MRRAGAQGFTLLEILISIGVTAMIVTVAIQIFLGLTRTQARAMEGQDRTRSALVLLDRIERELAGTLLIEKPEDEDRLGHPYFFIGDHFGVNDSDGLRFITLTPARPPDHSTPGGIRMITYGVVPGEGDGADLVRQEDPLPEGLDTRIEVDDGVVVAEGLERFSIRYLNDETGEWETRWNSTDIARIDRLPEAVEITVQMPAAEGEEEGEARTRLVKLEIRPIDPTPAVDEEAEDDEFDADPEDLDDPNG